jgi:hypothetical protein
VSEVHRERGRGTFVLYDTTAYICVTACIEDAISAYTPPTSKAIGIMMMMASGSSLLVSLSTCCGHTFVTAWRLSTPSL